MADKSKAPSPAPPAAMTPRRALSLALLLVDLALEGAGPIWPSQVQQLSTMEAELYAARLALQDLKGRALPR